MSLRQSWNRFAAWVNGDPLPPHAALNLPHPPGISLSLRRKRPGAERRFYYFSCAFICAVLAAAMLYAALSLPLFGEAGSPTDNEVSRRYVESGLADTGAANLTAGMVLDYRAFDTLGESFVLFSSVLCVVILLRRDENNFGPDEQRSVEMDDLFDTATPNIILQTVAAFAVPLSLVFGFYIALTGHLTPGGGFAGGAILSGGLILYSMAYGPARTGRVVSYRLFRLSCFWGLLFFTAGKAAGFYRAANGLPALLGTGAPGSLFSGGMILPLNLCIGVVTAAALYGCYALFSRGDFK